MTATRSIGASRTYWITDKGRAAIDEERCRCRIVIEGLLWVCQECGTIYGRFEQLVGAR
jgi:hypothetical protein